MKTSNAFILPAIIILLLSGFVVAADLQLQQILTNSEMVDYVKDQQARHNLDRVKLNSAQQGEIDEINNEILSQLGWQELMELTRSESANIEVNKIIEKFFSWDESYIQRLESMQEAYDIFDYITIKYDNTVKSLRQTCRSFKLNKLHFPDGERFISNPINPHRRNFHKNNNFLSANFNQFEQSYNAINQDLVTVGLIGYLSAHGMAALGEKTTNGAPDLNAWSQMLVQSSWDELTKIPEAIVAERRKREQAKAVMKRLKPWLRRVVW